MKKTIVTGLILIGILSTGVHLLDDLHKLETKNSSLELIIEKNKQEIAYLKDENTSSKENFRILYDEILRNNENAFHGEPMIKIGLAEDTENKKEDIEQSIPLQIQKKSSNQFEKLILFVKNTITDLKTSYAIIKQGE